MKLLAKAWRHYQKNNLLPGNPEHARSVFYAGLGAMRVLAADATLEQLKEIDDELEEWCREAEQKLKPH